MFCLQIETYRINDILYENLSKSLYISNVLFVLIFFMAGNIFIFNILDIA